MQKSIFMQFLSERAIRDAAYRLALILALGALGACASVQGPGRAAAVSNEPLKRVVVPTDAGQRELMTQLLAGEIALDQAEPAAAQRFADAAQVSDDPAIAERATRVALATRQWDLARAALSRWETLHGDEASLRQARAMLALHDGKSDTAYADLLWFALRPDGAGWVAVAQILSVAEDQAAAGGMLERLLAGDGVAPVKPGTLHTGLLGSRAGIWILVSQTAVRLDRKPLADSLAEQAVARFHNTESYAWAAQLKLGEGDKVAARKIFADALEREKKPGAGDSRLRIAYAKLLGEIGDNLGAAQVLAQGRQGELTYPARAAYLARIDDKSGVPAITALYREVAALPEPRPPARIHLLGQLAELLERKTDALAWYAQVPSGDEHWFSAQLRTAVLLSDAGKNAESESLLHELQARTGDDVKEVGEAFLLEAELLTRQKHADGAVAAYDRGLQVLPDDTRLLYARALLNDDLDHVDAAVRDLRRVLELKPDDADAMNALGYTLADRTADKAEALSLIQKALALKPGEPAIIDSLGWVKYRLGDLDAAIAQLRTAYKKQPDPEIAAHLGEVLWVSGQKDEARKIWDQGRKKDNANKVLLETIRRLAS